MEPLVEKRKVIFMTNTFPVCMSMCTYTNGRVHTWVQYKIIYWKCFIVGEPKWSSEVPINNNVWCISNVSVILQPNWQLSTHEFHHWNEMKCTAVWHWTYHTLNIYIEHIHWTLATAMCRIRSFHIRQINVNKKLLFRERVSFEIWPKMYNHKINW